MQPRTILLCQVTPVMFIEGFYLLLFSWQFCRGKYSLLLQREMTPWLLVLQKLYMTWTLLLKY